MKTLIELKQVAESKGLVLIYISTLENHRKGWSREIPEPAFSIYLTFLPCIPLNHNPLPRHKRIIQFYVTYSVSIIKITEYEIRRKHFEDLSRTCNEL